MMIVGYGNFTHGADDRGDMLFVVRAKPHERDHKIDEVICEPLLGRASVQLMSFPILQGCHRPIVSNAPIPDLPAVTPERRGSTHCRPSFLLRRRRPIAPQPTFPSAGSNGEVGWTAVIPELLGPRYR
jgi:hypothetical protein